MLYMRLLLTCVSLSRLVEIHELAHLAILAVVHVAYLSTDMFSIILFSLTIRFVRCINSDNTCGAAASFTNPCYKHVHVLKATVSFSLTTFAVAVLIRSDGSFFRQPATKDLNEDDHVTSADSA